MRSSRYFLVLLSLIVAKAWLYRTLAYGDRNPLHAMLFELPALLLVFGLIWLFSPRSSRWPLALTFTGLSIFMLGSAGYVVYFNTLVTPAIFSFTRQLGTLQATIAELWGPAYLLFLIDLPAVLYFAARPGRAAESGASAAAPRGLLITSATIPGRRSGSYPVRTPIIVATVLAAAVLAGQVSSIMRLPAAVDSLLIADARGTAPAQIATALRSKPDPLAETATATRFSTAGTVGAAEPPADETPAERLVRLTRETRGPVTGTRLVGFDRGAYEDTPIILVQVEALPTMDIGAKLGGRAVTPNFSAFAERSYYWPNTVPQLSRGNTSDVEWTVNTGIDPPVGSAACLEYADKVVPALPRLLGEQKGYTSFTGHANAAAFWNRNRMYPALGFGRYYDKTYFGHADQIWSGASDEVFFKKGVELIKAADAEHTPYYANLVTLSSHHPFTYVPQARAPFKLASPQAETTLGHHLSAISYTDKAFGEFIEDLDEAGVLDRAVVVVVGDHWAVTDKDLKDGTSRALVRRLLGGRDFTAADRFRVPLMIHLPGQLTGVRSETTVGQVDIAPTLADAVGLDLSEVPVVGRSVFERHPRLVQFRAGVPAGSFANDRMIHLAGIDFAHGTAIKVSDGAPTRVLPADKIEFERSAALSVLCDEWLRLLPDRSTANDDEAAAVIPNRK